MALNTSQINNFLPYEDTYLSVTFVLDNQSYDVEHFNISFSQRIDYKGQPQHETLGGIISLMLSETVKGNIYDWAKRSNKQKDGLVLFKSKNTGTVMEISFTNAHCIRLTRSIDSFSGTKTLLDISPEKISLNGFEHDNNWKN